MDLLGAEGLVGRRMPITLSTVNGLTPGEALLLCLTFWGADASAGEVERQRFETISEDLWDPLRRPYGKRRWRFACFDQGPFWCIFG